MNTMRLPLVAALSLAGLNALAGQAALSLPPGMESRLLHNDTNSPWVFYGFAKDPFTEHLYLSIYHQVLKVDAKGKRTLLHALPTQHGTGLIAIPPNSQELLYTNFNNGDFFRHHLLTNKRVKIKGVANSFDVAVTTQGEVLVVANPKWPSTGAASGIWLMDMKNANHGEMIKLTGPSGPIALDAGGNLLYAVQPATFPAPKGSVYVVRFPQNLLRKAIGGGKALTMSQASVVLKGLDGALDMAFDDRQRLYISDPQNGGLVRTLPGSMKLDSAFLKPSTLTTLGLQFVDRKQGTFDGFQPQDGGELYLATTDWVSVTRVWRIRARRPALISSPAMRVPKGPLEVALEEAPKNAAVWLALSASPPLSAELPLFYEKGVPGWVGLDLSRPHVVLVGSTDAGGRYRLRLQNPGGNTLHVHLQALAATSTAFGTSNLRSLVINP